MYIPYFTIHYSSTLKYTLFREQILNLKNVNIFFSFVKYFTSRYFREPGRIKKRVLR